MGQIWMIMVVNRGVVDGAKNSKNQVSVGV